MQKMKNILDKIFTFWNGLNEKQRYGVFVGILVFFLLLNYFFLMNPQLKSLGKMNVEIKELTQKLERTTANTQRIVQYRTQVAKFRKEIQDLNDKIKAKTEMPLILERISRIANQNGVKIDQIMPDTGEQEVLLKEETKHYFVLPVFINARSSYHDLGRFINRLESDKIFLNVKSFTIEAQNDSKNHDIRLTLEVIAFENI
ncbi:hypothetical protein MNBD_UNCLBAC01-159 [hydrothermal vent metagenome]|uniref:Type IV pilus biogenesis protein PilO n=1 Tax=hydrothermal vent metagenome TaxID=652676 RepID=A0A3B1DYY7_9ZZZZ